MYCLCVSSYNNRMSKKLLSILGILLLLAAIVFGVYTFIQRHKNNELLKNPTPKSSQAQTVIAGFNKKKFSINDPTSPWIVVNKKRPLNPIEYAPADLVMVGNDQQLRKVAADDFVKLINAAKIVGMEIAPLSGYRSYDKQVAVYGNEVKNYGQTVADSESARPGYSEHQTGLSVDVGGGGCGIEDCFGNTTEGKWLAVNAYKYGYIIRYTAAKQAVTGYRAEPWHIRYVGVELARELHDKNIATLEEFFKLAAAPTY